MMQPRMNVGEEPIPLMFFDDSVPPCTPSSSIGTRKGAGSGSAPRRGRPPPGRSPRPLEVREGSGHHHLHCDALVREDPRIRDPVNPPTMAATAVGGRPAVPGRGAERSGDRVRRPRFAHLGSYGSVLLTPNLDRLAARGLRFTNFHTTAVCSPTHACLLTGRNHHRVGMGMLPDLPTNFPAYSGQIPPTAGTLAQILRGEGYTTFCVGKWHLVPRDPRVTGPYDMWPTGLGFDRYYGFLNGETNQWTPNLVPANTNHVEPPPRS